MPKLTSKSYIIDGHIDLIVEKLRLKRKLCSLVREGRGKCIFITKIHILGIVLSVTSPLKGVSSYFHITFRLCDCPSGLGNWPRWGRAPRRG